MQNILLASALQRGGDKPSTSARMLSEHRPSSAATAVGTSQRYKLLALCPRLGSLNRWMC